MLEQYPPDTRIWLPDNDQGWISAKVVATANGAAAGIAHELKAVDEHGKVSSFIISLKTGPSLIVLNRLRSQSSGPS